MRILQLLGLGVGIAQVALSSDVARAGDVAGIPLLSFDQASRNESELGSEYRIDALEKFYPKWQLRTLDGDASARLSFTRLRLSKGRPSLKVALWGQITQRSNLPVKLSQSAKGISVELASTCNSIVRVVIEGSKGNRLASDNWQVGAAPTRYRLDANLNTATAVHFEFDTSYSLSDCRTIAFDVDDLVIETGENTPFVPPKNDAEFLDWLARSSFNFFDWNFVQTSVDEGVVLERQDRLDQVSASGQGYAIAMYIIGSENGYLDRAEAQRRVSSIVNWLHRQKWYGGDHGWHGFPYHWSRTDKTPHWPSVSTVDWAMLAAGLRVARQYFADDPALVAKVTELLSRPAWAETIRADGRIGMGFRARDGSLDPYSWGLAFSEESELVYLEAIAADRSNQRLLQNVERKPKFGFCPSWFASGFTYNWMQLWTGPLSPLSENSRAAFASDLRTNIDAYDRPLIGLTAMQAMTAVDEDGFFVRPQYFSHQGSRTHLTPNDGEVVQIAPAPYGAALALPFIREESVRALREFVDIGFYHEHLGLPDSVLLKGLPKGIRGVPSYRHLDLNIGALGMAIDQAGKATIADLYRADPEIAAALEAWQRGSALAFQECGK